MGIADIFEALTAKDRPYKKGKTLSESLEILGRMKRTATSTRTCSTSSCATRCTGATPRCSSTRSRSTGRRGADPRGTGPEGPGAPAGRGARTPAGALYLLAVYALTLPSALIAGQVEPSADLLAALKLACAAAFAWHAAAVARGRGAAASALALAAATGLVWTAVAGMPLRIGSGAAALRFPRRDVRAGRCAAHAGHRAGRAWRGHHARRARRARLRLGRRRMAARPRAARGERALCPGRARRRALRWPARLPGRRRSLVRYGRAAPVCRTLGGVVCIPQPDRAGLLGARVASSESVFIVQLESVNAHAVFERTHDAAGISILAFPSPASRRF